MLAGDSARLRQRTLTALYNERPTGLASALRRLGEVVFAADGWPPGLSDDDLLALNLSRAAGAPAGDEDAGVE